MPRLSLMPMDTLGLQSLGEHFLLFEPAQGLLGGPCRGICSGTERKPAEFNHAPRFHRGLPPHGPPSITWERG